MKYLIGFLSQLYFYPVTGAVIITAASFVMFAALRSLLKSFRPLFRNSLSQLAALSLIAMYNRYDHPLGCWLALAAALWCTALYRKLSRRAIGFRIASFTMLLFVLYYFTVGISFVFVFLTVIHELSHKNIRLAVSYVITSIVIAYLAGIWFFSLLPYDAYLLNTPFHTNAIKGSSFFSLTILRVLFAGIPLAVCAAVAWEILKNKNLPNTETQDKSLPPVLMTFSNAILSVLIPLCMFSAAFFFTITPEKYSRQAYCYSREKKWNKAIQAARNYNENNLYRYTLNFDVNLAMYHTGRLPYDMFSFAQNPESLTLIKLSSMPVKERYSRVSDLFYQLGFLNGAEHWTTELIECREPHPEYIERLARIYLAKEQVLAGTTVLNSLSGYIGCNKKANKLLMGLQKNNKTANDPEIEQVQSIKRTSDYTMSWYTDVEKLLLELLQDNENNRMAFEYLMAHYLLTRKHEKLVQNLYRLKDLGYKEIPRHYAEAAMIYMDMTKKAIYLPGYEIAPGIIEQYKKITTEFKKLNLNREVAAYALKQEFGDSYFYYAIVYAEVTQ